MRIRVEADGRELEGTAVQIVQTMRSLAFTQQDANLSDYVDWAAGEALRMMEVEMNVTGDTEDEKCSSLVREMLRTGLAEKL